MIPVMTAEDIHDATETFARYGVPADRIFSEIMRARYLDYVLFQNPENQQYGVSIEDLYENMKKTSDTLGLYEGDADTYVRAYTLALRVDPMAFAPDMEKVEDDVRGLVEEATSRAKEAGTTVLFTGVENYLPFVSRIFDTLSDKRLAFAAKNKVWKKRLQLVFPRCRLMMEDELAEDTVSYDYIFQFGGKGSHSLSHLLKDTGVMDVVLPYEDILSPEMEEDRSLWTKEGKLSSYEDMALGNEEFAFLRFGKEISSSISFGTASFSGGHYESTKALELPLDSFRNADEWNIDVFIYNGSPALQTMLAGHILDMDYSIGTGFSAVGETELEGGSVPVLSAANIRDYGIFSEVDSVLTDKGQEGVLLQSGDLAIAVSGDEIHMIPVPEGQTFLAGEGVYGLRSLGKYTPWYLKLYLDGPVGRLLLDTMRAGRKYAFTPSRLLRIPMPQAGDDTIRKADSLCRDAVHHLAEAQENWRLAKRNSVGLMMGHGKE